MSKATEVLFKIKGDASNLKGELDGVGVNVGKLATGLASIAIGVSIFKELAGAVIDVGKEAETAFAFTSTLLQGNAEELGKIKKGIIDVGANYGLSAKEALTASYDLLSSGVAQNDVVQSLEKNTRLATASGANLGGTVKLTSAIMNSYKMTNEELDVAMNQMLITQNKGVITVEEMTQAYGSMLPIASATGTGFDQISSAMAVMTLNGMSSDKAATALRSAITELSTPSTNVAKILKEKTGQSFKDLMEDGASLTDVLGILEQAAKDDGVAVQDLFGSVEAVSGVLNLTGDNAEVFNETLAEMNEGTGLVDASMEKMTDTADYQQKVIKEKLNAKFIELYDTIAKKIQPIFKWMADNMDVIAPILIGIATAIGVLTIAFGIYAVVTAVAAVATNALLWPILLIVLAIVGIITVVTILYNKFPEVKKVVDKVFSIWVAWIKILWNVAKTVFTFIVDVIKKVWTVVMDIFNKVKDAVIGAVEKIQEIWGNIVTFFTETVEKVKEIWGQITTFFEELWTNIVNGVMTVVQPIIDYFAVIVGIIILVWTAIYDAVMFVVNGIIAGWQWFFDFVVGLMTTIQTFFQEVWANILAFFQPFIDAIKYGFQVAYDTILGVWGTISGFFGGIWSAIVSGAQGAVSWVVNKFQWLFDTIRGIGSNIGTFFSNMWSGIVSGVSGAFTNMINSIKGFLNSNLVNPINNAISVINGILPVGKIGSLPSFAVGTNYVPNDMIAQIHKGEAIVPAKFNNDKFMGGGGDTIAPVFNITGGNAMEIGREVADTMDRLLGGRMRGVLNDSRT